MILSSLNVLTHVLFERVSHGVGERTGERESQAVSEHKAQSHHPEITT